MDGWEFRAWTPTPGIKIEDAASRTGAADATLFDDVLSSSPDRKEGNRSIRMRLAKEISGHYRGILTLPEPTDLSRQGNKVLAVGKGQLDVHSFHGIRVHIPGERRPVPVEKQGVSPPQFPEAGVNVVLAGL